MRDRRKLIWEELIKQCKENNIYEFEYYFEIWGVMWYPWFIEFSPQKPLKFTANDISYDDLNYFISCGDLELIKEYTQEEMKDEFGKKRYKLKKYT